MNKTQLVDALAARYDGNKKAAAHALESVIDTITREVAKGEKVAITGFGSFEKRLRPARIVRNPQTGAKIRAKKTFVPKFSAGAELKAVVAGAKKLPKLQLAGKKAAPAPVKVATTRTTSAAKTTAAAPVKKAATTAKTTAAKTTATKTAAKKAATPAKTTATKTAVKKTAPVKKAATTAKTTTAKTTAAKTTATKASVSKAAAPAKKAATTAKKATPAKKATSAKKA